MPEFDLAIIGAGSAGLSVAYAATHLGLSVALIERGPMGGECLNTGCVPSKALLAAAHAARAARRAARLGVRVAEPEIDWDAVRAHVRRAVDTIAPVDSADRYAGFGATVLRASARFTGPGTLDVEGWALTARRIVVAAGSAPAIPDIPGVADVKFVTNETLFAGLPRPDRHRDGAGARRPGLPGDADRGGEHPAAGRSGTGRGGARGAARRRRLHGRGGEGRACRTRSGAGAGRRAAHRGIASADRDRAGAAHGGPRARRGRRGGEPARHRDRRRS